ncbi:quinate permease [Ceraceosorus bombacis]|uniref:Quinate transporter n=1 Tax=Ceraceosorus bombacis TaxID=401625 RepID=A0A0P1BKW1_9BASI|nr:quinate permease [Ceraceosorus bombacis]
MKIEYPPEINNLRIWGLATVAAFASGMIGYDSAFVGGTLALPAFLREFGTLDKDTSSNLVSTYQAGAFFGAFAAYPTGVYLGRKWGLFAASLIFNVGSIIMTIASNNTGLGPIYGGRAIAGLAIGMASNLAPTYLSEIAPTAIRGRLIGMWEVGWQVGAIIGFWINYGVKQHQPDTSDSQWRIPYGFQLVPGALLLFGTLTMIESPRWLLTRGREEEAVRNLEKIRKLPASDPYLVDELALCRESIRAEREVVGASFWGPIRYTFGQSKLRYRMLIASSLFAFQNGTGINAINYYSPTVFRALGLTGTSTALLTTGVFGIIKGLGSVVWILWLIEQLGRRKILMGGAFGGSICMFWIAIYIAVSKVGTPGHTSGELSAGGRSALAAFYLWTLFYGSTWNGTPWCYSAEMFPTASRSVGMTIAAASNWLYNFAISKATPAAFAWSNYGFFLIFACLMVVSIPYVFFVLPETRQVPLERMDDLFATRPVWRAGEIILNDIAQSEKPSDNLPRAHPDTLERSGNNRDDGVSTPERKDEGSQKGLDVETGDARNY